MSFKLLITPHRACAARGKVIVDMDSAKKIFYSFNSISEIHFNTGKLSSELMASSTALQLEKFS